MPPRLSLTPRTSVRTEAVAAKYASFDAMVESFEEPVVLVGTGELHVARGGLYIASLV